MDETNRAEQAKLAAQGDPDALQRLILHYHASLHRFLEARIDGQFRRHVDPDDVLQEAYVAAFSAAAECSFDSPAAFYRWLETIARNQLRNRIRALKQLKRDIDREAAAPAGTSASCADLIDRLPSPQSTPSRRLSREEAAGAMLTCLARLTADQRTAIRQRFLEGRPVSEIAAGLGKSETAVHMLFHRGLKRLRELMGSVTRYLTQI